MEEWVYCRCMNICEIYSFLIRNLPKPYSRCLGLCIHLVSGWRLPVSIFDTSGCRAGGPPGIFHALGLEFSMIRELYRAKP